ncbi:MAG: DMT family transporter [Polaromonas sp.]|nr:DMT family transporter [Polaromonas sp.]
MRTRHFTQLIGMSALWGASFPLVRIASPVLGPWVLAAGRCVLASLVLGFLLVTLRQRWPARQQWPALALLGLGSVVLPFMLFNWAALALPASYSAVLNATVPLFGILGAALVREERLTGRRLVGCAAGFVGVALLVRLGPVAITPPVIWGALACIAASASYGFSATYMKRASVRHAPLSAAAAVHVAGSVMLLLPAGASLPQMQVSTAALLALGMLGFVTSGFMYWVSLRLMREIPASAATSAAFMIPLFGVTWGGLFLGEPVTASMLPGGLLIFVAMVLVTGFNPFRAAPPEP